jgi:hypothetical protein
MRFYKQYCKNKFLYLFLLWSLIIGSACQALSVEDPNQAERDIPDNEMPVILQLIGSQIRDNYQRINTWTGEIDEKIIWIHTGAQAEHFFHAVDTNGKTPKVLMQNAEEKVLFAIDAKKNFIFIDNFREKPSEYFNYNTGEDLGNRGTAQNRYTIINKPDFLFKAEPIRLDKNNKICHMRAVKKTSKQDLRTGLYESSDDPRNVFAPGWIFTWDFFDDLTKRIEKFGKIEFDGYKLQIKEYIKDDIVEYKVIQPAIVNLERSKPEDYVIITKIFSSKCGFNMISLEDVTGSGTVFQKHTWEYELVNGVYLHKRTTEKHYGANGEISLEKDCTYTNNKVNQGISPETFTYKNLGLKDGDEFIDKIEGKEYKVQDANLVFVADINK